MKTKIILYLIFFISSITQAQDKLIDSLLLKLHESKKDNERVILLNEIADQYKYSDPIKMEEFGRRALILAQKNNNKTEEGSAYLNIGTSNIIKGDYKKALENFVLAKDIFENLVDPKQQNKILQGLAKTHGSIGVVFSEQSNYNKALQSYLKSVKIYEKLKDEIKCSKLYNNIGIVYKSQNSNNKALEYFIKAQRLQEKYNDVNLGITLTNIANIYFHQKSFEIANNYYTIAKKALDENPNPRALGEWYNNKGLYFEEKKQDKEAVENWKKAIVTFQLIEDKFGMADSYLFLGAYYFKKNQLNEALQNVIVALKLASEIEVLEQKMLAEKLLSEIYTKKGNFKLALEHFKKYSDAKDSITNEENIRKAVESSMNYEFEKKELFQKEANEKRELLIKEEAKIAKVKIVLGGLIILLLAGIGFLIYNRKQLKETLILQKELAEYEQKALHLQMNPHFVFNCLGSISSFIVQNGTDSAIKYLTKFSKLMRLTLEYSKESLIPIDKEIESLQNYLELEQLRFNNKFNFTIEKSDTIEDDVALAPLLIQPFVENAIMHGIIPKKENGIIAIKFSLMNDSLICTITDNGIGINQSQKKKENSVIAHKSMAINIIKKRLERISSATAKKASITIKEQTENNNCIGTKVVLQLPLQYL